MKRPFLKIDDSLIISRLQQKELRINPNLAIDSQFFPLLTQLNLKPFFDNLPLKVGFDLKTIGNQIVKIQIEKGYFYQDLEQSLSALSLPDAILASGRLHWDAPIFYQAALFKAFRALTKTRDTPTFDQRLAIAMEFGRVSHHARVIYSALLCLNLTSLAEVMNDFSKLLEAPIELYSRMKFTEAVVDQKDCFYAINEAILLIEELRTLFLLENKLTSLQKKCVIGLQTAGQMGLNGLFLRANRLDYDLRHSEAMSQIYTHPIASCVMEGGDAYARFHLRVLEIEASLRWLKQEISGLDVVRSCTYVDFAIDANVDFAFFEVEGPQGHIKMSITPQPDNLLVFHIRTPAYFIAQAIPHLFSQVELREFSLMLYLLGISAEEIDK